MNIFYDSTWLFVKNWKLRPHTQRVMDKTRTSGIQSIKLPSQKYAQFITAIFIIILRAKEKAQSLEHIPSIYKTFVLISSTTECDHWELSGGPNTNRYVLYDSREQLGIAPIEKHNNKTSIRYLQPGRSTISSTTKCQFSKIFCFMPIWPCSAFLSKYFQNIRSVLYHRILHNSALTQGNYSTIKKIEQESS